jgi:hypothetical protein
MMMMMMFTQSCLALQRSAIFHFLIPPAENLLPSRHSRPALQNNVQYLTKKKKSKAVPLHTLKAHGGRGGIAPTHS